MSDATRYYGSIYKCMDSLAEKQPFSYCTPLRKLSFLAIVELSVDYFSGRVAIHDNEMMRGEMKPEPFCHDG